MRQSLTAPSLAAALTLLLAGCGNSTPLPPSSAAPGASSTPTVSAPATSTYVPSKGAFAAVPATLLQQAVRVTPDCNLDAVNDRPPGSVPLQHAGSATFTGWAGDTATGAVPAKLQLLLTGPRDYAVGVATGLARADVASAQHKPAFVSSGYAVDADLSTVAAGDYGVTLLYTVAGQSLRCPTKIKLSVQ